MKTNLFLLLTIILLSSCREHIDSYTEPLLLRQLSNVTETNQSSSGSFMLFFASYRSETTNEDMIKVFAKVDGSYRFLEIPMEMVKIKLDNTVTRPYVQIYYEEFFFKKPTDTQICDSMNDYYVKGRGSGIYTYMIVCPEKYLPEELLPVSITHKAI